MVKIFVLLTKVFLPDNEAAVCPLLLHSQKSESWNSGSTIWAPGYLKIIELLKTFKIFSHQPSTTTTSIIKPRP